MFGPFRQGGTAAAALGVTNSASGGLADVLVTTLRAITPGFAATAPGAVAQGGAGSIGSTLDIAP